MWKAWRQKCEDDSETKNWLSANTKPCPKCDKPVEKNGGCNLVVCSCGQAFCWLCGSATGRAHTWTNIEGHSCGRWKDEAEKRAAESDRQLRRYLHYYTRWRAHLASQKQEVHSKEQVKAKIVVLEDKDTELKDYTWLMQALEQLCDTRGILAYSYAFAFFMFGNDMFKDEIDEAQNEVNKNLFEDQQQQLESEAERLSGLIQTPENAMDSNVRLSIINSASNIEKRLFNLYKLIENDLLGQLQYSNNYIAPYKGISTLLANDAANDQFVAAATAAEVGHSGGSSAGGPSNGGAGPSGSSRGGPAVGERQRKSNGKGKAAVTDAVVDLTGDDNAAQSDRRVTRGMAAGKRPAPPAALLSNPRQRH